MHPKPRENLNLQKLRIITRSLDNYFAAGQGIIMGNTAVVSKKVHEESLETPGEIGIFRDRDAGCHYLRLEETNKIVHIDVLHQPGEINQIDVANRIRQVVPDYLRVVDRNQDLSREEQDLAAANLVRRIHLCTAIGGGTAFDPCQKSIRGTDDRYVNHVHLLANLLPRYFSLVYCIIDEVERSIMYQGCELRPVVKIVHHGDRSGIPLEPTSSFYLPPLQENMQTALRNQNLLQIAASLAMRMGSIEAVADFFQALSPVKNIRLSSLHKNQPDLDTMISAMINSKLIKKSLLGYSLTNSGRELQEFLLRNQKELGVKIRKAIRQSKAAPANCHTLRYSHLKSREKQFPNRRKVLAPHSPDAWKGEIALAETLVKAAKRSFVDQSRPLKITHEDIRVYARKSYAPVDTCLLVDCSGSMIGNRIKSVGHVAEYLLLNSREKVSLVTFQETSAKVAVPFTRHYDTLHKGLASLSPEGMTPLAHGITAALDLFKQVRPRNPLLILITDGIPNYPLWSTDPIRDALEAARKIADNKIRFVCIGIDPDHKFLPLLAEAAKGNVYIVDDNDRNNMIDIISRERKQYQHGV